MKESEGKLRTLFYGYFSITYLFVSNEIKIVSCSKEIIAFADEDGTGRPKDDGKGITQPASALY